MYKDPAAVPKGFTHDKSPQCQTSRTRSSLVADASKHANLVDAINTLLDMAFQALPTMYCSRRREFARTVRRDATAQGGTRQHGTSLRYTAIVSLGIASLARSDQQKLMTGLTAQDLLDRVVERAFHAADLGTIAVSAWAAAEIRSELPAALFDRLIREIHESTPQLTVDYSWALTALVAANRLTDFLSITQRAATRLMSEQEVSGLFPHALPRQTLRRYRAHIASFADQVYPILALARYFALTGDHRALHAANRCAAKIVAMQGPAGQWWWHYDIRTGAVVEGYPVYSVHQHAMGPMALFDLYEAGGANYISAIAPGLCWLYAHPEVNAKVLDHDTGLIWRKIYRREPLKLVRGLRSASTALSPRIKLKVLDQLCPTTVIDYGCHSYELGWLFYAWKGSSEGQIRHLISKGI